MIKINLLPIKAKRRSETGQRQLIILVMALVVEVVVLALIYQSRQDELSRWQDENRDQEQQIEKLKSEIGDIDKLEREKKDLEKQEQILSTLEQARTGPVRMMDDLAYLLSPISDIVEIKSQERLGWNVNWDPRRLWLVSFQEKERRINMAGYALSNDDVSEFVRRLRSTTRSFQNIRLTAVQKTASRHGLSLVVFKVTGSIRYSDSDEFFKLRKRVKGKRHH